MIDVQKIDRESLRPDEKSLAAIRIPQAILLLPLHHKQAQVHYRDLQLRGTRLKDREGKEASDDQLLRCVGRDLPSLQPQDIETGLGEWEVCVFEGGIE